MKQFLILLKNIYQFIIRYSISFFRNPFPGIAYTRTFNPLGFTGVDRNAANKLIDNAKATVNGLTSFWLAGAIQGLYITNNLTRHVLIREAIMGVTTDHARHLHRMVFHNDVMINFLVWQNVNSDMYKSQRRFLDVNFKKDVAHLLSTVEDSITEYCNQFSNKRLNLKKFVYGLTLHIGSRLPVIGLSIYTLDELFHTNPQFEEAVYYIAQYGTSRMGDPKLEKFLYEQFSMLICKNYNEILMSNNNLLKNNFESRGLSFHESYEEFKKLDVSLKHNIAMNFLSVAIGGMLHTTANSFDWLLARLSLLPEKIRELSGLIADIKYLNLEDKTVFESTLRPIRDFTIENVLINPTFTHEYFVCEVPFDTILPDGKPIHVNKYDVIVVNYLECNRSEAFSKSQAEMNSLLENQTTEKLTLDKHVASFGGSIMSRDNNKTRICPGRVFSLYEQMIMLTSLLKNYELVFKDVDCSVDDAHFPLHGRQREGQITLKPTKAPLLFQNKPQQTAPNVQRIAAHP